MKTKYIKLLKKTLLFTSMWVVLAGTLFTSSCKKEEGSSGITVLNSFGPSPVARGAELRFIGENLDKVDTIVLPGDILITSSSFVVKTSSLITITVPQNAVPGTITLKTPSGPIETKTRLGFSEPISITNFSPAAAKADAVITITGDYLNLIKQVIFTSNVAVNQSDFISQSRYELKVKVPAAAQTGKIAVSNGADDPIIVYSTTDLTLKKPVITSVSPNPVKAGSALTITGTDLDLVKTVRFGGLKSVTSFTSQSGTQIVVNVPADAQDDTLKVIPASGLIIKADSKLVMVVPTANVSPMSVKNGADITVTGTNLDLVDHVTFAGNVQGTIKAGGTATQIVVTVPNTAVSGDVSFVTKANKTVTVPSLVIIDPVFSSFSPSSGKAGSTVTIDGTDLDLVTTVTFTGGINGTIANGGTATQINVTIPVGAKTGKITLTAKNGNKINSSTDFTVTANLPNISSFTETSGVRGKILTINGTNMLLIKSLVFPGNITATDYGTKSDTKVEVYVPTNATTGYGNVKIVTYEGEVGLSPEVFISGTDPVADPTLMINDFEKNAQGHDLGWDNWGGNVETGTDVSIAISGNYMHGTNTNLSGWSWIWGCNHNQLPKVSVTKAGYVLKMDVRVSTPLPSGGNFQFEMGGSRIDLGQFGMLKNGSYSTVGWVTMTWDLSTFSGLPATIPASGEWGLNSSSGTMNISGLYIDNVRFEKK